jgi:uncharacterized membrane protein
MEEKLKHSILGIISTVFATITIFVFGTTIVGISFQIIYYHKQNPNSTEALIAGLAVFSCSFLALIGITLGLFGFFEKTKKKTFSIIGLSSNLLYFITVGALFLIGLFVEN